MRENRTPVSAPLSPEQKSAIQKICSQSPRNKGGLLPALHAIQDLCGNWLPLEALQQVSWIMDIPYPYLYGVVSFYTMLSTSPRGRYIIRRCNSAPCHILGADNLQEMLKAELGVEVGETTPDGLFTLEETSCLGACEASPNMQINEVIFGNLTPGRIRNILADYRRGKVPDYRQLFRSTSPLIYYPPSPHESLLLDLADHIDPMSLEDYLAHGGYEALQKALFTMSPKEVIDAIKISGLRGRGGAGFPTGLKWSFTRPLKASPKYIVCNNDEGEPGTVKDRTIMEGDPHKVLEGMAIAGYAVGASFGYVYVRGEYYLNSYRLAHAIREASARRLLGDKILGTDFSFHVQIQPGAGSYVCGEETALIESIEGKRGYPRVKPPFPGTVGLWGKPTVVNNVETLASVPSIISRGPEWYRAKGTQDTSGTKIYQVVGHVQRPCIVEADLGMTVRELIYRYGGGIRRNRPFKMCQTGGASFGFFKDEHLDTPMEFAAMAKAQGALGSGTLLVMDSTTCVVDVVRTILHFFQHESCGFCLPCRRGTRVLYEMISRVAQGQAQEPDLERMVSLSQIMVDASNCAMGMSPYFFIRTTIERFRDEYLAHLTDGCPAGVCKP